MLSPPLVRLGRSYNAVMRCRLAQIVVLSATFLLTGKTHAQVQTSSGEAPENQGQGACLSPSASDDERPASPEISIAEVTFSGSLQLPISDQDQIVASIKERTHGSSLEGVIDEALERVKAGWQDRGYFKVEVSDDARTLTSNSISQRIALDVHVDEGLQYKLGSITFKHNKAISNGSVLRGLFPIQDGDIFSRNEIATGLDNLRSTYTSLGYINFTSVPNTKFDDEKRLISLEVDIDEDKQFYFTNVNIMGLDDADQQELLKDFPMKPGQVYDSRLLEAFMVKYSYMWPDCGCGWGRKLDAKAGTVTITLDFRACPVD
jgi:hypothetical protein